jgi:hypothetical protein
VSNIFLVIASMTVLTHGEIKMEVIPMQTLAECAELWSVTVKHGLELAVKRNQATPAITWTCYDIRLPGATGATGGTERP